MNIVKILVGMPYSGKSTYIKSRFKHTYDQAEPNINQDLWHIISTDYLIDQMCHRDETTYHDGFDKYIKQANLIYNSRLNAAIKLNRDIIVDRTNITTVRRIELIKKIRSNNSTTVIQAIVFQPEMSLDCWMSRISQRPERVVPFNVLKNMAAQFQYPEIDEGFDDIMSSWQYK